MKKRTAPTLESVPLPPGRHEMWAIVFNGPDCELMARLFESEETALHYGRVMAIQPVRVTVETAPAVKLVRVA